MTSFRKQGRPGGEVDSLIRIGILQGTVHLVPLQSKRVVVAFDSAVEERVSLHEHTTLPC